MIKMINRKMSKSTILPLLSLTAVAVIFFALASLPLRSGAAEKDKPPEKDKPVKDKWENYEGAKPLYKNAANCNKFLSQGWIKTYKYQGVGNPRYGRWFSDSEMMTENSGEMPSSIATQKEGSLNASGLTSVENSTASVDPKHWSVASEFFVYDASSSGSVGPCKYFLYAKNDLRNMRNDFFEANSGEILKEISVGEGEALNVLAEFSLCERHEFNSFSQMLQKNMGRFVTDSSRRGDEIDSLVSQNSIQCQSLTN